MLYHLSCSVCNSEMQTIRVEAIATRVEIIASGLEAIALRLEAIATISVLASLVKRSTSRRSEQTRSRSLAQHVARGRMHEIWKSLQKDY